MSAMTTLLPTRVLYSTHEPVQIEIRGLHAPAVMELRRLGTLVASFPVDKDGVVNCGALDEGGYSVSMGASRTAVQVTNTPHDVHRYGFVVDYSPGRDLAVVSDNLRRLHLTDVQFYDWAYRHADLVGGGETYDDALGQPVSLGTVRALINTCHEVGSRALGYAAVYAIGPEEWPSWQHAALVTATGHPYALGDFLFILDPALPEWREHFSDELERSVDQVGFDGFHLDQYGYPKRADRADGERVDVAQSFRTLIESVRDRLPNSRLVFNNVNDFPTWITATTRQDAVYIEVWKPQVELGHLAAVVDRARSVADGKPVVIAAYQHVYSQAEADTADRAAALTMATLFSHGASHLLAGEADRILVDPYYVRNHRIESSTADLLQRYYDFAVAHYEILFPAEITDVTGSFAEDYNDDIDVTYTNASVSSFATAGTVWRRVTEDGRGRYMLHAINLTGQVDTQWDAPRGPHENPGAGTLRIRRMGTVLPRIRYADPDAQPDFVDIDVVLDGDFITASVPAPLRWQVVLIDPYPESKGE